MCVERWRTRDRLLDYNLISIPRPRSAGLAMVYPWEDIALVSLAKQIYILAQNNGYLGTEENFWKRFIGGAVIHGTIESFPIPGDESNLYLDDETEILYYFKATTTTVYTELAAKIGAAIVGTSIIGDTQEEITYLYIPVRAMPIENLIIDCGTAADYID